jgi:hypothetical protein
MAFTSSEESIVMEPISYLLPKAIADAVAADGLPRVATDLNGSGTEHVLYLERGIVHSMLTNDWQGPLPTDPTQQQIAAALAAREAARVAALAAETTKRVQVLAIAQSAVGVQVEQLTLEQLRALYAITLWQAGALDAGLVVRPLGEWVRG